jgi:hypothetical protein
MLELTVLAAAGVNSDRVFTDKLSGAANTSRPGLAAMLDYARATPWWSLRSVTLAALLPR